MTSRIEEVLAHLDANRAKLDLAVSSVPEADRGRRPGQGRWSTAEVLEHLAIVEGSITNLLRTRIDQARAAGLGTETDASAILPTVPTQRLLDRTAKITAGEKSLPTGSLDAKKAKALLDERRVKLKALIRESDGLALANVVIPHGVLGPLNAYQWLVFVGAHEGRHAKQIEEIGGIVNRKA